MVIRSNCEVPSEASPNQSMESKKYIVVKNHVREIVKKDIVTDINESVSEHSQKKNKKAKKQKQTEPSEEGNTNEISKSDLEELQSVYKKCKDILKRLEFKYGHLLETDDENEHCSIRKRRQYSSDKCNCSLNKKILYNDDGQQVYQESSNLENHICPKKLRNDNKTFPEKYQSIEIEEDNFNSLPESIQELTEVLKDPSIRKNLRYTVINKIKNLREENLNMLRFDRMNLIQQLRSNPEEIMDFKGTNISSLTGYPTE